MSSNTIVVINNFMGAPIPYDDHAVSVSLPTWKDVVGYEEGHKRVLDIMKSGYPRFKIHSSIEKLTENVNTRKLNESISTHLSNYVLPTEHVARRFQDFLNKAIKRVIADGNVLESYVSIEDAGFEGLWIAFFPSEYCKLAKAYWQHTGEIISSRRAEDTLNHYNEEIPPLTARNKLYKERKCLSDQILKSSNIHPNKIFNSSTAISVVESPLDVVKSRISSYIQEKEEQITLCVSGMAAIFSALRLVQMKYLADQQFTVNDPDEILQHAQTVVFGFPYIDTLKLNQRPELNPGGTHFYGNGNDADMCKLEDLLASQNNINRLDGTNQDSRKKIIAVFAELPSNPLLCSFNLTRLTQLARKYDFSLIVDDTISSFCNVDLLHGPEVKADILCSSLTKIFSGRGDSMAGSLTINSNSPYSRQFLELLPSLQIPSIYYKDAVMLEINSRDYPSRCHGTNINTRELVQHLNKCPHIQKIFYPTDWKFIDSSSSQHQQMSSQGYQNYTKLLRRDSQLSNELVQLGFVAGYGCLFSLVFDKLFPVEIFYDALNVAKGPSLGTNFTLVCPYTLLAHYNELPWAEEFGVDRFLIRVSVGLETIEELKKKFDSAIKAAEHSKEWEILSLVIDCRKAVSLIIDFSF